MGVVALSSSSMSTKKAEEEDGELELLPLLPLPRLPPGFQGGPPPPGLPPGRQGGGVLALRARRGLGLVLEVVTLLTTSSSSSYLPGDRARLHD